MKAARRPLPKDCAASARVLGFATPLWCLWGIGVGAGPVARVLLGTLAVAGVVAGVRAHRAVASAPGPGSHDGPDGQRIGRFWLLWTGIEGVLIAVGAVMLGRAGQAPYIIAWAHVVMGLHFVPLARIYGIRTLMWTGLGCVAVAAIAASGHRVAAVPTGPVVGILGSAVLLCSCLVQTRQATVVAPR